MSRTDLEQRVLQQSNQKRAVLSARFFKTKKGEYGYGDVFLGTPVPILRKIARSYYSLHLKSISALLHSQYHEFRFIGLIILIYKFQKADEREKGAVYKFYLQNLHQVNNWDLVDCSAPHIMGEYLLNRPKAVLYRLAHSNSVWNRRIAIIATLALIREGEYVDALKLSRILLPDSHDLIQKAVGWMLREVGKQDKLVEIKFIRRYRDHMSRTTLRYAIEKFDDLERQQFLRGSI